MIRREKWWIIAKHASSKWLMKSMAISVQMKYFSRHVCKKVCKGCSDVLCCSDVQMFTVQMFRAAYLAGFVQDEDVVCCTNCFLCNGHNLPELRVFPRCHVTLCWKLLSVRWVHLSDVRVLSILLSVCTASYFHACYFSCLGTFLGTFCANCVQYLQWLNFCVCAQLMELIFFSNFHSVCTGTFTSCSF